MLLTSRTLSVAMDSTSSEASTVTSKIVPSGMSGSAALQYLNPDYMPPSVSSTFMSIFRVVCDVELVLKCFANVI